MSAIKALIGDTVIKGVAGDKHASSDLGGEGKVLGLYFSAHWCGPCRAFTPHLVDFYKSFKTSPRGEKLEIIFVSSDQDEGKFKEYYEEMPWFALPFEDRKRKAELSKKFKVQGIPTLVFVDASSGALITDDGRSCVTEDPQGANFPWSPKPLADILKGELIGPGDSKVDDKVLEGKVLGLYFSAHWCPPCRGFTPKLVETYQKLKAENKNIEVVFVSSDRADSSFKEYFAEMPWYAIPYQDERGNQIKKHFAIQGIPSFVLLDENRKLITSEGRAAVSMDPEGKEFPWLPKPLVELTEMSAGALNENSCLIYFTDGEEAHIKSAKEHMQAVAEAYKAENEDGDLMFFYEGEDSDIAESLRGFARLGDTTPLLALVDIPQEQVYIYKEELSENVIKDVVQKYKAGNLEYKPIKE